MLRPVIACAAIVALCRPAHAQTYEGCFSRTYDAAHLAAHTGQTVTAMKLKIKPRAMDDGNDFAAELRFAFRDDKRAFFAVGICKDNKAGLTCGLDQDAGQISVTLADGGVRLSPISDVRADSESGQEDEYVMIKSDNPENGVFALPAVPAADCKEFDTDE